MFIGDDRIEEFYNGWKQCREGEKENRALDYYISGLTSYFPHVETIGIPVGSKRPVYYLVYTTRNSTGKKIMQGIIAKAKRKGTERLERWLS